MHFYSLNHAAKNMNSIINSAMKIRAIIAFAGMIENGEVMVC